VKAGSYTVIEEPISSEFVGGSSVGPLFPFAVSPAPESSSMSVVVGSTTNLDITLTDSQPRFDQFEGK
jgi:hypothetical protein